MKLRLLQLAVAATIVAFVVIRSHPSDLWRVLRDVDPAMALAALALNVPVLLLAPLRSSLVFRRLGYVIPADLLVSTTILGFVAGGLTPAASGELLRAQTLSSRAGVPMSDGVVAVVYERVLSLYILILTTMLLFAARSLAAPLVALAIAAAAALCFLPWLGAVAAWRFVPSPAAIGGDGLVRRSMRSAASMAAPLRILLLDVALLVRWASISVGVFALVSAQYWLLARGVGGGISFGEAWVAFGISTMAGVAALIPFGLGVLDGSLAATLDRFGMTLEQGGIVALLVRATVTLPLVAAAFACYLYLQRSRSAVVESTPATRSEHPLPE